MEYETAQGRQVEDVHDKNRGYDLTSLDLQSGELRLIEVKGLAAASGSILLTPNERRVAEDRRDCYWLYVVTHLRRPTTATGADQGSGALPLARGHQGAALLAGRQRAMDQAHGRPRRVKWPRDLMSLPAMTPSHKFLESEVMRMASITIPQPRR